MKNDLSPRWVPGFYYELKSDVGPIPAGVYQAMACDQESIVFQAGKKVSFIIAGDIADLVKQIPQSRALLIRTSQTKFLDRYYELLEATRAAKEAFSSDTPLTMCFIDPTVAREVH